MLNKDKGVFESYRRFCTTINSNVYVVSYLLHHHTKFYTQLNSIAYL